MTQWDDDRLPYASAYHTPIMVGAVLEHLCPAPSSTLLDATLGGAGHTLAMLERGAHVLAIDRDPDALDHARARLAEHIERVTLIEGNYGDVVDLLARHRAPKVDGVLLDAGVSSHQIDEASRGFSSRFDAPLDMRMSSSGDSAADLLERSSAQELGRLLADYGELKGAFRIARGLKAARENGNLDTTAQLRDLVLAHAPKGPRKGVSPVTLVFQALRIAVNEELAHLERFVASIPRFVRPGGTVAIISFHSLEDRVVKRGLRALEADPRFPPNMPVPADTLAPRVAQITRKPITADRREVSLNPRARSAKLRVARVLDVPDDVLDAIAAADDRFV